MPIDESQLLTAIDAGRAASYGTRESSVLGQKRARAIEYYLGLNTNPAPEGRSQVVDRSVYETISTILPSLVRIFAGSSDEVCKFVAVGPDDEQGAELTTAVVNYVVTQQNQWEQLISDWIHDAALSCNGYAMAYWDEDNQSVREVYEGQSDDQVALLLQDTDVKVVSHSQAVDAQATQEAVQAWQSAMAQYQQAAAQAQVHGQQVPPPPPKPGPVFSHDLTIERTANKGKVCIRVLPPEHCSVHQDTPNWTLQDCPYFEVVQEKTIGELRAMGLDVPDDISDDCESDDTQEDRARDRFGESDQDDDQKGPTREVETRMIWIRTDAEGDGIVRLYYVLAVGRTILHAEPVARIPVASMTPQPLPHRHIGMSLAETVMDVQDVKTAVTRGGLDNLYLANNGRHVISSRVNLADFLDARPGGVVRMLDDALPAEGHVMPLTHPFAFDSIIGSLEYFDQIRQNRSGASRYFSGTDANAINKTASGTIALQNMASMRVEHIARMMAPAVEALFSCVLEIIQKHQNKPLTIKLKGQWVAVDPQAWRTKRDVRISVGVGAGNKESMVQSLMQMFGAQMQVGPMTGLAGPQELHATVTEIAKLAGFANPGRFWKDPANSPPVQQPPSPEQIKAQASMQELQFKAQQEQQKTQADQAMEQLRLQHQAALDQNREEMQARQKQLELQQNAELERMRAEYQAQADDRRLEFEKWKAELDASVKLTIANTSAQTSLETTQMSKAPDNRVDELIQTIQRLEEEANSPAELVRDPQTGRAVGVRRAGRERKIVRGPDGRAIGLQ